MKPNAILTSDWHLREDTPLCRTDDYWEAQWKAVKFIFDLSKKYECQIYNTGDLFNKAKPSLFLISKSIESFKAILVTIPGQHDLPNHSISLYKKSGLYLLDKVDSVWCPCNSFETDSFNITSYWFGEEIRKKDLPISDWPKIALIHTLVHETEAPVKIMGGISAKALMKKLPGYDLIITGDNHKPFVVKQGNQLLVNPGSMMRMSADQVDHKPRVYLWYAEDNHVEPVYLPIEQGVIDRSHIDDAKKKDENIAAFVKVLQAENSIDFDFETNLRTYFNKTRVPIKVKEITWAAVKI